MRIKLIDNGNCNHAELFERHLSDRISVELCDDGEIIEFVIDSSIGKAESYKIMVDEKISVIGADELGLYYGIGKLLHSAKWCEDSFTPKATDGVVSPACDLRISYFPIHFYNWYQTAPIDEIERYLEEILLWGYNTVDCIMPVINSNGPDDPVFIETVKKVHCIFAAAKKRNMRIATSISTNQGWKNTPNELDAERSFDTTFRGKMGRLVCPAKSGGTEYLCALWENIFSPFADIGIDYIITWPYDEGGCGCKDCRPWGGNGYLNLILKCRETALKYFPKVKFIVSTWAFDAPNDEGDYDGLYSRLKTDLSWVDAIMTDSHGEYPKYVLEHEIIKPVINFPEVSMYGLSPWGGFGANPLPERHQRNWDSSKHIISGGMPYSEGLYDDMSRMQYVGYYWSPDKNWREILSEYVNYEYSADVLDEVFELFECVEKNHTLVGDGNNPKLEYAVKAKELAEGIDVKLPERAKNSWRWRVLYIRVMLDFKRYSAYLDCEWSKDSKGYVKLGGLSGDLLVDDEEAQTLFKELWEIYHSVPCNGENVVVLPPLGGTKIANALEATE